MTRRPSSPAARATFDALDWLDGKKTHDIPGLNLTQLRLRAHTVAVRYEAGRPVPDGYPTGTDGPSSSDVRLTSTEAAAEARGFRRRPDDPVHEHAHRMLTSIARAAHLLQTANAAADAIDRLCQDAPLDSPACELCTQAGITNPRAWEHYGTIAGRLTRPMHLCVAHHDYIQKRGDIPTPEQTRHHDTTGRWRIRETA